ncbi:MAG: exodeoxyribonuclease VII small subunit [Lawsonibacter sp.]|nr:exodeoxyribonuclease VII small subunit [Lawsonibacter sp.]
MAAKKKLNFEGSMVRLEEIVSLLEKGDAPLEQAMALFEEGAKLLRECTKQLDEAEQKVTLLTSGKNGELVEEPFGGME